MFTLYIRNDKQTKLRISNLIHTGFHSHGKHSSYREAVLVGQQLAGYGNFYVDTSTRVPSTEEQLLAEPRPRRYRNSGVRNAALLED